MADRIDISILLPVKNGEKCLEGVLRSVRAQKSEYGVEILSIDSGSTDRTVEILTAFDVPVVRINPREFNHGLTRNRLAEKAKGRFLFFLNQDVVLCSDDALNRLAGRLRSDEVAAVFARQKAGEDCRNILWLKEMSDTFPAGVREITGPVRTLEDWRKKFPLLSTACAMIKADLLKEHPFQEIASGEDQEWAARILNTGYRIIYDPAVEVIHSHDESLRGIYAYYVSVGRASAAIGLEKTNPFVAVCRSMKDHLKFIARSEAGFERKMLYIALLPFQVMAAECGRHRGMTT